MKVNAPLSLSPRYTEKHWNDAFDGREDWDTAINIVEDRIRGRWLDAADQLLSEPHSGFAIVALDCIVLESLWGFMNGVAVPQRQEKQAYRDVLAGPTFGWSTELSDAFRQLVRNGIMHDAETRSRWLIKKTVPRTEVVQRDKNGDYALNRTKFHSALEAAFEGWLAALRAGDVTLRKNMRRRMDAVIARHYVPNAP
jgi:hypothetical protein